MSDKYNWKEIQEFYDKGNSWRDIQKEFGCSRHELLNATKKGNFKSRSKSESVALSLKKNPRKHTEETKKKISEIRKEYLKNNPDKHFWKNNKKFKSIPCEKFKKLLKENNVSFIEEFQPLENRLFSIDIAFPEIKIGIEINGNQHYDRNGNLKPYYQERKNLIEEKGWKLYDYHYTICYNDEICEQIIKKLKDKHQLENYSHKEYIKKLNEKTICPLCGGKKDKEAKICKSCHLKEINNREHKRKFNPSKEELDKLIKVDKISLTELGRRYGVSDNAVRKRAIKLGIYESKKKNSHKPKKDTCPQCGKEKWATSKVCLSCHKKRDLIERRKFNPTKEELDKLINFDKISLVKVGEIFGVSDNAVKKRAKKFGIYKGRQKSSLTSS